MSSLLRSQPPYGRHLFRGSPMLLQNAPLYAAVSGPQDEFFQGGGPFPALQITDLHLAHIQDRRQRLLCLTGLFPERAQPLSKSFSCKNVDSPLDKLTQSLVY